MEDSKAVITPNVVVPSSDYTSLTISYANKRAKPPALRNQEK